MDVACLIGNGSSTVYNPDLAIGPLTTAIVAAFNHLAGSNTGDALAAFTEVVTGTARSDFEGLLGPLDSITQALPVLGGAAAPFANVAWVAEPLDAASSALRRLHQLGLGTALQLIADRAHGQGAQALHDGVGKLASELALAAVGGRLTIGTLNYDGLVMAALPEDKVADLGRGWGDAPHEIMPGVPLTSWPLRTSDDLPNERPIHLLQLHGSLGWVRTVDGVMRKFRIDDLRSSGFWTAIVDSQTAAQPVVVLTDRKDLVVQTAPFALAYEILEQRLLRASHWCIAGYSFLDVPVNRALSRARAIRRELGYADPRILVLGYEEIEPLTLRATQSLGAPAPTPLWVDADGLPGSVGGEAWNAWASS